MRTALVALGPAVTLRFAATLRLAATLRPVVALRLVVTLGVVVVAPGALAAAVPLAAQQAQTTLTLDEALRLARERNPAYRKAQNVVQAAVVQERAGWGGFLPTVSASMGWSGSSSRRVTGEDDFGQPRELEDPISFRGSSASQSVGLQLTLFDGFATVNQYRAARAGGRAARAGVEFEATRLTAEISRRYYAALRAAQLIELEERLLVSAQGQLSATERLFRVAAKQQVDVLGAQVEVANREQSLALAQGTAEKSKLELAEQIGLEEDVTFDVAGEWPPVFDPDSLDEEALVAAALDANPTLTQAEARAAQAAHAASAAGAARWPRVTASTSVSRGLSRSSYDALFEFNPRNETFSFGVSVSVPLFTQFRTSAQIAAAEAQRKNAEEDVRAQRLAVERETRSALIDLQNAHRNVQLSQRSVELARRRLELARQQYELGALSFTELQAVLDQTANAERQAVTARFELATAAVTLEEKVGRRIVP